MADRPLDWELDAVASPRALLYALAFGLAVALVVAATTSSVAFGAYNAEWDGAAELRAQATAVGSDPKIIRNTSAYATGQPDQIVALVLSPTEPYTAAEIARIRRFVRAGGTLVVAEDVGPGGNDLLRALDASARFNGTRLRDETEYFRSPNLPVATTDGEPSEYTAGVTQLTLNYGTTIDPGTATVLARSSRFSYLDTDGDETLDETESLARRPVVTVEQMGTGRIVAVADSSLFINAMLERPGNRQFTRNLFASRERVLLDYSHTASIPPLALALLLLRETPWLQALVGLGALGIVVAWGSGLASRDDTDEQVMDASASMAPATQRAVLRRRHPDWDEDRIERLVTAQSGRAAAPQPATGADGDEAADTPPD